MWETILDAIKSNLPTAIWTGVFGGAFYFIPNKSKMIAWALKTIMTRKMKGFIMFGIAEQIAKSTKWTTFDDKLVAKMKEAWDKE
jgi:hypothetical protein